MNNNENYIEYEKCISKNDIYKKVSPKLDLFFGDTSI